MRGNYETPKKKKLANYWNIRKKILLVLFWLTHSFPAAPPASLPSLRITDVNLFYWDYRDPSQIFTYSYNIFPPSHQFSVKVKLQYNSQSEFPIYLFIWINKSDCLSPPILNIFLSYLPLISYRRSFNIDNYFAGVLSAATMICFVLGASMMILKAMFSPFPAVGPTKLDKFLSFLWMKGEHSHTHRG